jgi:hypothetical protein
VESVLGVRGPRTLSASRSPSSSPASVVVRKSALDWVKLYAASFLVRNPWTGQVVAQNADASFRCTRPGSYSIKVAVFMRDGREQIDCHCGLDRGSFQIPASIKRSGTADP